MSHPQALPFFIMG